MDFSGLELFLDDELIAYTRNIRREVQQAQKHEGNPIITREYPWEARHATIYGSVLRDEARGVFRMWYNAYGEDYYNKQVMAYAESEDGVNWVKPMMDVRTWEGYERTNILMGPECNLHGPCVIRNPDQTDHERHFLLLFDSYPHFHPEAKQLGIEGRWCYAAESPDGLRWSPERGRPAFPGKADSGQSVMWVPEKRVFRAYARLAGCDAWGQGIRASRAVESPDFIQWGDPVEVLRCDEADGAPDAQLQQLAVTRFGDIYVGLIGVFRIKQYVVKGAGVDAGPQLDDIQLVTSRDGFRFTRVADRAAFIPKSEPPKWGTGGQRAASHMLLHEDKVLIYYGSRAQEVGDGLEIGLATTPRDRFVALVPERMMYEALVELVPLTYPNARLTLNASGGKVGAIQVEVVNFEGNPASVEGFTREDSVAMTGDSLDHELLWHKDGRTYRLDALPEKYRRTPVRLRLWITQSRVHAMRHGS